MARTKSREDDGISYGRVAAYTITLAFHLAALAVLLAPASQQSPTRVGDELGTATEVTFITFDPPVPSPAPPPPPPPEMEARPILEQPKEADPVEMAIAEESEEPAEVFEMPSFQVPQIEEADAIDDKTPVAQQSQEYFDAMAGGAEPAPDWEPTEVLSFRKTHPPRYPPQARRNGETGWVLLRVLVGTAGEPLRYAIDPRTTATELLIQAAIEAIDQWKFKPAVKDGHPVVAWMVVPVGFFLSTTTPASMPVGPTRGDIRNES